MNIILSPHFDDAVLSLGGFLAQEGKDTLVATFFAGTPQTPLVRRFDTKCGFADSTEAMLKRAEENKKSLNFFGVTDDRIRNYAHLDSQYRLLKKSAPTLPESELETSVQQEIVSLIREFSANPLKLFIPGLEMGKVNLDHLIVKRAALAAIGKLPHHATEFFFYQDLPYAANIMERAYPHTFWNFITRNKANRWDYSLLERSITNESLTVSPNVIALEPADMKKKLAGINLYTSQVNNLDKQLLKKLEKFSAAQAQSLSLYAPYCEVVYKLIQETL